MTTSPRHTWKMAATVILSAAGVCAGTAAGAREGELGDITVTQARAQATAPAQPTGAAFATMTNHGPALDRLVSASTPAATEVQFHTMTMDGNVMRMRQLAQVDLPPGKTVRFDPSAMHMMLIGLKAPLKAGGHLPMTLKFEHAGALTVDMTVDAR